MLSRRLSFLMKAFSAAVCGRLPALSLRSSPSALTEHPSRVSSWALLELHGPRRTSLSIVVDDFPESVSRLSCIKFYHGPVGRCNDSIRIRVRSVITCDRIGSNACLDRARRSTVTR
ncbi:exported hypothetical protein [Plantibacter sp. T3]|nr:exported hypothetical protein [Plantibacter sp. T3]